MINLRRRKHIHNWKIEPICNSYSNPNIKDGIMINKVNVIRWERTCKKCGKIQLINNPSYKKINFNNISPGCPAFDILSII